MSGGGIRLSTSDDENRASTIASFAVVKFAGSNRAPSFHTTAMDTQKV
jgi:hypothetical protein